jgi:hypothetical protein
VKGTVVSSIPIIGFASQQSRFETIEELASAAAAGDARAEGDKRCRKQ